MPTKRDGKTYYYLGEAAQVFGIAINTLLNWISVGEIKSYMGDARGMVVEEQSLRACIARHQGGR